MVRCILAFVILAASPSLASAGAWTRAKGETFTSQTFRYFATDGSSNPKFERVSVASYSEYGLLETVTLGFEVDQGLRLDEAGKGQQGGRIGGFVRARVFKSVDGAVASIQVGASIPVAGFEFAAAPGGDDAREYKATAMLGRGFSTEWGDGWLEFGAGFAHLTGGRADELKFEMTLGLKPGERFITFAQVFATKGLENAAFAAPDFDVVKAQFSIGATIFDGQTIILGVARDIAARGLDKGTEASIAFWSTF